MRRPRTLVGSAVPLVLLIGLVGLVPAAAASGTPTDDDDAHALALLRRAVLAATTLGYSGTQVVTSWRPDGDTARLVAVEQFPDGRRVETLRDAAAERRSVSTRLGASERALALRALDVLAARYRLTAVGGERVAGRDATVVTVQRGASVAARMWVDDTTGLLLRQEVNDTSGHVRRMFTFIDLRYGAVASAAVPRQATRTEPVGSPVRPGAGPVVPRPRVWDAARSDGERRGWCADVGCPAALNNGYRLLDVRRGSPDGASVVQLVYGDGLSSVSVFLQPGRLDPERLTGFRADRWEGAEVYVGEGWPTRLTWQGGPRVFTAVSDAAPADLHAVISTFPHDRAEPDGGAFAAVGRGMRSVLEWLQGD